MSMSIEELDATVRAFYEGRGETVCSIQTCAIMNLPNLLTLAKASSGHLESGTTDTPLTMQPPCTAQLTPAQFKENPDAWLLVDKILSDAQYPQTKCK
jgi:hypothetical protein